MKKISIFLRKNYITMLLSFVLPIVLMAVAYYNVGVYPGSKLTILASDSFSQYSNFHASLKNVLQSEQSIFYTWSGSLGLNYWTLAAYYLNGIFAPLVVFFDNASMPDTLYYLTLLKFGASGLAFWFFAHHTFKINRWIVVSLSVSYALMAYMISYSPIIMFLDAFVYLPLITWGIHRLVEQKKPIVLFASYLLLFLSSYYMGFMIGVFTFLYFCIRLITNVPGYRKSFVSYMITSFLAGGASMVTILPMVLDLRTNGESLTKINNLLTPNMGSWDIVAKSMVGVYDTTKESTIPFIYIGLLPLIFCVYYFFSEKIALKEKIGFLSLLLLLIASLYVEPLNLFWHGFHAPNMFGFRYSYLISFLIILLAGYGLEKLTKEESNRLINIILAVGAIFIVFVLLSNKKRYDIITQETLIVTIALLFVYLSIYSICFSSSKVHKWLPLFLMSVMIIEAGINAKSLVAGVKNDWSYPSRKLYTDSYDTTKKLMEVVNERATDASFFRLEDLTSQSLNRSFNFGYHGVTMFSSIRNRHSSQYLNRLGFRSLGTNLTIKYANNTLLADALVGVKYNIAQEGFNKFGYTKIAEEKGHILYENQYALPLGMLTDGLIYEEDAVKNQTELFNHLSGQEGELFSFGNVAVIGTKNALVQENEDNTITIAAKEPEVAKEVTWLVTAPAKKQTYLSLTPTDFSEYFKVTVQMTIDGTTQTNRLVDTGQYYDLGYHEEETAIEVTVAFSGEETEVELFYPEAVFLDTEQYVSSLEKIKEKGVEFEENGRKATASVNLSQDQVLLTTIPYDKGWKVLIDGEKAEIKTFKDAFLSVEIPAGKHDIAFIFLPEGFALGLCLFISCLTLFIIYVYFQKRKRGIINLEQSGESR